MQIMTLGAHLDFNAKNPSCKRGVRFVQVLSMDSAVSIASKKNKPSTSGDESSKWNVSYKTLLSGNKTRGKTVFHTPPLNTINAGQKWCV